MMKALTLDTALPISSRQERKRFKVKLSRGCALHLVVSLRIIKCLSNLLVMMVHYFGLVSSLLVLTSWSIGPQIGSGF